MIEKDFRVASRIVEGLDLPLSPAQMTLAHSSLPPVSARPVRPTAQQMFRSKASGAAAAARRAALLEARAEEAAARPPTRAARALLLLFGVPKIFAPEIADWSQRSL